MKSNEQAKQEAIKKAWVKELGSESEWLIYKPFINSEGWLNCWAFFLETKKYPRWYKEHLPYDLKDIKSNKGWIRIEPDGSNLPTEFGRYLIYPQLLDASISVLRNGFKNLIEDGNTITHYKPIKPIKPEELPIY